MSEIESRITLATPGTRSRSLLGISFSIIDSGGKDSR
jgi:hypothetical protein